MGNGSLAKRLLGTTALVGGVLAGGALSASDALAQSLCPASSLSGTGNVSNAVCNAVGTPVPFTLTLNLNWTGVAAANTGSHTSGNVFTGLGNSDIPAYANSGGPGHHDWGFMTAGWIRFTFDAPAEGDQHYGFHLRFTTDVSQQTTTTGTTAGPSVTKGPDVQHLNNSVSHAPTNINREWAYWKSPKWGQVQMGSEGSGIPGVFMVPANEGPPGSAIQTLGPGTGIESILFTDTTTGQLDAGSALLGSDAMRTKGALGIRYISPNFLGSTPDYGFTFDFKYTPDGRPYNDGNFATDSFGSASNADLGESVTPKTYMSRVRDIIETTLTWEELFAKDYDVTLAVGGVYGISKNGLNTVTAPTVAAITPGGVGTPSGSQKANSDLTEAVAGASLVWREALTFGGGFTYAGKSLYPSNTPAYTAYATPANPKTGQTVPGWGASFGVEYDWDRYQVGAWYQYATDQGDMNNVGYIQIHYIGVAAGMKILKGLKVYSEAMWHAERNNHADQYNAAVNGGNDWIHGGGCGDGSCQRNATGMLFLVGTSLDF